MRPGSTTKAWLEAIRPRTLPLALSSITMGSFLASAEGAFDGTVFLLAGITTIFLQILSNLANDYGDSIHGADSADREGPRRAVQSGLIPAPTMRRVIYGLAGLTLVTGMLLLFHVFPEMNPGFAIFLFLGVGAILAAMGYTMGKRPYGYAGLGDLFVFLFFGLVGVMGTFYLHTGRFQLATLLPAISSGLLATAVLNVNNIRDIPSDILAGKRSIPVRLGRDHAVYYHIGLIGLAMVAALMYVLWRDPEISSFLFVLTLPLFTNNILEVRNRKQAGELDPSLKKLSLTILLFTLLFGIGLLL